jgi:hypothetical protein
MRSKNAVAPFLAPVVAIAVAMGVGASVVPIPAHADTQDEQLDQAFLDALQQKGVPVKSRQTAIGLAHSTCDLLHRGGTVNDALLHVKNATSWSVDQITAFAGVAVYAYCRDQTPK